MANDAWTTLEELVVDGSPADSDRLILQKVGEEGQDWKRTDRGTLRAGLAPTVHTHAGTDIVSGVVAPARLGTGTPNSSKVLKGDGTWGTVSAGATTVREADGSPSVAATTVEVDQAQGLSVTDQGSGVARIGVANASTSGKGVVQLATPSSDVTAGHVVQASDTRLSDARAPTTHTHNASDVNAGTLAAAQLPTATTSVQGAVILAAPSADVTAGHVVQANDTRLSNTRIPTSHGSSVHTGNVLPGTAQDLGATYLDAEELAAPANPTAGTRRIYVDSTTHKLSVRTSAGASVSLEEQPGSPSGSAGGDLGSTYPNPQVVATHLASPLPVAQGGSGAATLAAHGVVVGNDTGAVAVTGAGMVGQVLTSNGPSADPSFLEPWQHGGFCDHMHGRIDNRWITNVGITNLNTGGETGHPGIGKLSAPAGDSSGADWSDDDGTLPAFIPNDLTRFVALVRLPVLTEIELQIGLRNDVQVIRIVYDPVGSEGSPCFFFDCQDATSITRSIVNFAFGANTWRKLEGRRSASNTWQFYVDDVLKATISTHIPTVAMIPFFQVAATGASARDLHIDYFCLGTIIL